MMKLYLANYFGMTELCQSIFLEFSATEKSFSMNK